MPQSARIPRLLGALLVLGVTIAAILIGGRGGLGTSAPSPTAGRAIPAGTIAAAATATATPANATTTPSSAPKTPTPARAASNAPSSAPPQAARPTSTPTPRAQPTRAPDDNLPTIALVALPAEARETIRLIDRGGPFPYERDGITFGNRERLLPMRQNGYYREYTVITPGSADRGARRVIAGDGGELYYTDDHYESFRRVVR